jgi:hypothetical protein
MVRASLVAFALLASAQGLDDLQRARTKVPRNDYRADHSYRMGKVLNEHVMRSAGKTQACHEWSPAELQELQTKLHSLKEDAHNNIYAGSQDTRAVRFASLQEYQSHWAEMNQLVEAEGNPFLVEMQRDGHCLEVVMWWVHHLSEKTRNEMHHFVLPSLPLVHWREPVAEEGPAALKLYKAHYNPSSTCLACHGGGIPWQNPDNEPPPYPRQANGNDRVRRCDEYFTDPPCGPCDGIAGAYYGDLPDEGIYPKCEVVKKPEEVAKSDRAPTQWPAAFTVEMRGADRWPRASASGNASCNFTTDCSPYSKEAEGDPLPPSVPLHWYAQIHGVLYVDHNDGQFGGGRLRHETVYQFPSGKEGAEMNLRGLNGERNVHLTEIHVQTPEMAAKAEPGVMLNLEHKNMTAANASGADDSKLDWRHIPSTDGDCVCVPNPSGLPYFHGAYDNATYKGRVTFSPPWQNTGTYGPPTGKKVVADHFVKWTFHMFVDIETKLPVMFSSPFGGCATYGNWSTPDKLWPESLGGGWRLNPAKERCFAVTGAPSCKNYTNSGTASSFVV